MKILRVVLLTVSIGALLLVGISKQASAETVSFTRSAQLSGKLFAVSVVHGCPTEERIAEMLQKGVALGADYTVIPEVVDASLCPATFYGPMWGWHQVWEVPYQSVDVHFAGGVVVGLHYRVEK